MNIAKMIEEANAKSAKLYLQRQQLQMQLQQIQLNISLTEQELMKLDGEIDTLNRLGKENE